MNNLHFVQSLEPLQGGGLGKAALELHQQFLRFDRYSILVATKSRNFISEWENVIQFVRIKPDAIYLAPKILLGRNELAKNIDVFHGHGFYVATNCIFGHLAQSSRRSLVYHVHGMFEPWILSRAKFKKMLVHAIFENRNFKYAKLWRALTNKEADQIRRVGITSPIVVAANGIHLDSIDSAPKQFFNFHKKRVLFLGRIHPKKGLDILLQAWSLNKVFHKKWEIVIAGPDEHGYKAVLEKSIRNMGIADSVSFHGPVFGDEKYALIKSCDLFVLSSYSEGFSVAILEAMACSVPVLASTACNFPELYKDGGGFICEPEVESVAHSLASALSSDDNELAERGQTGRNLVEAKYTWEKIGSTILQACDHYC